MTLAIYSTGERGDSNGEESEGRKEEGGEEALTAAFNFQLPIPRMMWALGVGPLSRLFRVHPVTNSNVPHHIPLHELIDDVHARDNAAEHRVSRIEVRLR